MHFNELNLNEHLLRAVEELGYESCTFIQEKAIPLVLDGHDLIGQSQTGTGKTAAFGLPLLNKLETLEKRQPQILIITPTRELTMQVTQEMRKFAKYLEGVRIVSIFGGEPITSQIRDLKGGADVIVGTPGRLIDHMERHTLKFGQLKALVIDEADEMLKLGFKDEIEAILKQLPEEKQFLLFSATMPQPILDITGEYLKEPVHIRTKQKEMTVNTIHQIVYETNQGDKSNVLVQLLEFHRPDSAMIFCNTKKMVDDITGILTAKGYNAAGIHGDLKQEMRTLVMDRFKAKKLNILVCTDVAARGIDVDALDVVINYDVPQETEYYVHRIGRTGRAGKDGLSLTLITPRQRFVISILEKLTKATIDRQPLPTLAQIQAVRFDNLTQDIKKSLEVGSIPNEIKALTESLIDQGMDPIAMTQALLYKMVGEDLFKEVKAPVEQKRAKRVHVTGIQLDVGKKHGVAPAHLVSAIAEACGISGRDIGKIRITEHNSMVEVPSEFLDDILSVVNEITIKGYKVKAFVLDRPYTEAKRPAYHESHNAYPNKHRYKGKYK